MHVLLTQAQWSGLAGCGNRCFRLHARTSYLRSTQVLNWQKNLPRCWPSGHRPLPRAASAQIPGFCTTGLKTSTHRRGRESNLDRVPISTGRMLGANCHGHRTWPPIVRLGAAELPRCRARKAAPVELPSARHAHESLARDKLGVAGSPV